MVRRKRGFMLLDALGALAVLTTVVFAFLVLFRAQVRGTREVQEDYAGALMAESEMERLRTLPYDSIALGADQPLELTLPSADQYRQVSGYLTVTEISPGLKQATVRIVWDMPNGTVLAREMTGVFAREEVRP